jgi:phenylpyruvate tautomerase PptA (4-oxalocrotonate tautomerase family)
MLEEVEEMLKRITGTPITPIYVYVYEVSDKHFIVAVVNTDTRLFLRNGLKLQIG